MYTTRRSTLAALTTAALLLTACTLISPPQSDTPPSYDDNQSYPENGPHASPNAHTSHKVTHNATDTVQIADVNLGTTSDNNYTAHIRGQIYLPTTPVEHSSLIILNHLRAPNCQDMTFTYPCAPGVEEFRYDRGMSYLAEHLANQGYSVVVPDLGAIYIGDDVETPYSQTRMWSESVSALVGALVSDTKGETNLLGLTPSTPVDTSQIGMFVHSRSGMLTDTAIKLFGKSSIRSILAYGPAYDTVELDEISPVPADIPYLAIVGDQDSDVGPSANLWLGHYATTPRQTPASVAQLPGLGHMFINRAASTHGFDDRIGCDILDCANAEEHERVLRETATEWFNATLHNKATTLPIRNDTPLPEFVAGLPAHWLALTPQASTFIDTKDFTKASSGGKICQNADLMNPVRPESPCPEPLNGVMQILTPVFLATDTISIPITTSEVRGVALHVAPSGVEAHSQGVPVTLTFVTTQGEEFSYEIPATHPALRNQRSEQDNGIYRLGTVRISLPDAISSAQVHEIKISAPQNIQLRSLDIWK